MYPSLRTDLIWSAPNEDDGAVILKCGKTGRYFRFAALEADVLSRLDGTVSLEAIRAGLNTPDGGDVDLEELESFIGLLRRRGLLFGPHAPATRTAAAPKRRLRGTLLHLRLKAIDPAGALDWLAPRTRLLFTRGFVQFAFLLIAAAIWPALSNGAQIVFDIVSVLRPETLIAAWIVILASTVVHEFAHALTCRHFGGQVRDMGVMLIFFQPALYANVSDAWLFDARSKRLWVTFAGGFADLLIWALAVFAWCLFAPGTALHFIAVVTIATAGIRTIFNFNPLIKLDGYYLLSDWLEVPNLRARSFAYLRSQLTFDRRAARRARSDCPRRQRRILLGYSILAGCFVVWFLTFILARMGGWLVDEFQAWGFMVTAVIVWLLVSRLLPMRRAAS